MGLLGVVFVLFTAGYIIGVWTACVVLKQPQEAYEDGLPIPDANAGKIRVPAAGAGRRL